MDPLTLSLLILAAFVAAFFDSIVGGGGVISLPALLAAGLPPHLALGTNKLAATGASFMATVRWTRAGFVHLPLALALIPLAGLASVLGSLTVLQLEAQFIRGLVLVAMIAMTAYVLARKHFGKTNHFEGVTRTTYFLGAALALAVAFYDGFLGPGTGSFLLFGLVHIYRFDFSRAAALGRVLNLASNAGALTLFFLMDRVDVAVGLPMMAAMLVGAWFGSHVGIKHGARWIKPLFVAVTVLLMVRLLFTF